jgi:hypothetical protein
MEPITIIYTHNLHGKLDLLPKLHTLIRRLMRDYNDVVLLDMGGSCAADVWHCDTTGGRSALLVMDGMGYDAANIVGLLADGARERMPDTMRLTLIDADSTWERDDLIVAAARIDDSDKIQVVMQPVDEARVEDGIFFPQTLSAGQVGVAQIGAYDETVELFAHAVHPLPANTRPDPTIAGTVDFVLSEARYYQKRQSS